MKLYMSDNIPRSFLVLAESEILKFDASEKRDAFSDLRAFLRNQSSGALRGAKTQTIESMCDLYEAARGDPEVRTSMQVVGTWMENWKPC